MELYLVLIIIFTGRIAYPSANNEKVTGKVLSYGIYETSKNKPSLNAPDSVTGGILLVDKFIHVETTDIIPLILGKSFGFKFRISNIPTDKFSKFTLVARHPPILNSKGEYQTKSSVGSTGILPVSEIESYFTYEFTTQNELVPGDWTLEVLRNGKIIVSKSFEVREPSATDAGECEISGKAILWAYDACFWKHETDDSIHPGVLKCVDQGEKLIEKVGQCEAKRIFKSRICAMAKEWKIEGIDPETCMSSDKPLGPSVREGGI